MAASFSPDGGLAVTEDLFGMAAVWEVRTGRLLARLKGRKELTMANLAMGGIIEPPRTASPSFSPDGELVVTEPQDEDMARVWAARTGKLLTHLKGHRDVVMTTRFSPDGERLVTASRDLTARVWDTHTGNLLTGLTGLYGHKDHVDSASFSPDGKMVVTASRDKTALVWDARSGTQMARLEGHGAAVTTASFSPDGELVVTASKDKIARVWDARTGKLLVRLEGHGSEVTTASFSPDGALVVTASADKTTRIWDVHDSKLLAHLAGHELKISSFSQDGALEVTTSSLGSPIVRDAHTGTPIVRLEGDADSVNTASFSADGRLVVTGSDDKKARVWDALSGKLMARLESHGDSVIGANFTTDGALVVTGSKDKTARVWDAHSGKLIAHLEGHGNSVIGASFSVDGALVVTTSSDKTARVWEARSGKRLTRFEGHEASVLAAKFSTDGALVVTASSDGTARVWEVQSGALLETLSLSLPDMFDLEDPLQTIVFDPPSNLLVALNDQNARAYDVGRAGWSLRDATQSLRCSGPFHLESEAYAPNPDEGTCAAPLLPAEIPLRERERQANALQSSAVHALLQKNQRLAEALAQRELQSCQSLANPACQARALYLLGVITPATQAQRFREGRAQLEQVETRTPGPTQETLSTALLQTAVLLFEQLHRPNAAQLLCQQALALLPAQPDTQAKCAEIMLASGQPAAYLHQLPTLLRHPNPRTQPALLALAWVAARQLNDKTATRRHATELTQRYATLVRGPDITLGFSFSGTIYALRHSGSPTARIDPLVDVLYLLEKPTSKDNADALQHLLQR